MTWETGIFADQRNRLGAGIEQGSQSLIVRGFDILAPRHAESANTDMFQRQFANPLEILRRSLSLEAG